MRIISRGRGFMRLGFESLEGRRLMAADLLGPFSSGDYCTSVGVIRASSSAAVLDDAASLSDASAPAVHSVRINDGGVSRSQLTSLTVTFNTVVDHSALEEAFSVRNIDTDTDVTSLTIATPVEVQERTVVTLTFAPGPSVVGRIGDGLTGNSLADGNYRLNIDSGSVIAASGGQAMASNYVFGGQRSGAAADDAFFRLLGDANGDGLLDVADLRQFAPTIFNPTAYRGDFDTNGDGAINGIDLNGVMPVIFGPGRP